MDSMPGETKLERRLDRAVARAATPRGAAELIAVASIAVTFGAGLLMTVADHERYPSLGEGLWWAMQTTTTVGYGDNVPVTVAGRLVAAAVMLFGIGFLTVITAAITSTFVSRSRVESLNADAPTAEDVRKLGERLERIESALNVEAPTADQLRQLDSRLERIEAAVTRRA
jgi:voltage-gated potassium channel